jgi:hypothetical protein
MSVDDLGIILDKHSLTGNVKLWPGPGVFLSYDIPNNAINIDLFGSGSKNCYSDLSFVPSGQFAPVLDDPVLTLDVD